MICNIKQLLWKGLGKVDIVTGLKIIKDKLDTYEVSYYEYCEILLYILVFVNTSNLKGEEITETFIEAACEEGLNFMKKYANSIPDNI